MKIGDSCFPIRYSIIIGFAIILLSGCSTAPRKPDRITPGNYEYVKEYVSWLIQKEMEENQVIGVSIAVVDNQRIVWAQGFGYADLKNKIPATAETVYRIGSISKLFTATAAMQLAEQKRVDIDQPLKTYLPRFSVLSRFQDADPVTPRSIMTHHSGLPHDMPKGAFTTEPATSLLYRLRDQYVAYPPNYVLAYSNTAMALLGLMVQQVSGVGFCEYLNQFIFAPIGMRRSAFNLTPGVEERLSKGYKNGKETEQLPLRDLATGSMYSNVLDLSQFIKMLFAEGRVGNRQILQTDTVEEMLRPQNETVLLDFDQRVGLGWFLTFAGKSKEKIASHAGNMPLFQTTMAVLPEKRVGVAVLTNSAEGRRIYDKIAGAALKLAIEAKTGNAIKKERNPVPSTDGIASEQMLQAFVGRYATPNMTGTIERNDGALNARIGAHSVHLIPSANGQFGVERKRLGFFPQNKIGDLEPAKIRVACGCRRP